MPNVFYMTVASKILWMTNRVLETHSDFSPSHTVPGALLQDGQAA